MRPHTAVELARRPQDCTCAEEAVPAHRDCHTDCRRCAGASGRTSVGRGAIARGRRGGGRGESAYQIAADDDVGLDDTAATEDDVLGTDDLGAAGDFVAGILGILSWVLGSGG